LAPLKDKAADGREEAMPRHAPVLFFLFRWYLRWIFWRSFDAVRLSRAHMPDGFTGRPLVIYCNHPSWWDPALMILALPRIFPGRRGYGPMDAVELKRYGLFRNMGVFGIEPGTRRGAARFLRVAASLLRAPESCLCVTAEGAFTDPRLRPIRLRHGLAHLARRCPDAVFLPMALDYPFWNESKPEALLRFGPAVQPPADGTITAWQAALESALTEAMDGLAEESAARNPAAFTRIFSGTAGVGGVYDVWRRARATMSGQAFSARHQAGPNP
jgi:1-acyl-sn-glycerol-3-phosphate acyltransferase